MPALPGSGKPSAICNWRTADKYTFTVLCAMPFIYYSTDWSTDWRFNAAIVPPTTLPVQLGHLFGGDMTVGRESKTAISCFGKVHQL